MVSRPRKDPPARGVLRSDGVMHWGENASGACLWKDGCIWDAYVHHWRDREVRGRFLEARDYTTQKPIALLWPGGLFERRPSPRFQLYLNERLPLFRGSRLGHSAINVNGWVFIFSYRRNGERGGSGGGVPAGAGPVRGPPDNGRVDVSDGGNPRQCNFGRLFGRSIHVLRV